MMFALPVAHSWVWFSDGKFKVYQYCRRSICNTGVNKDYASRTSNGCFNRDQWETSGVEAAQRRGKHQGATFVVSRWLQFIRGIDIRMYHILLPPHIRYYIMYVSIVQSKYLVFQTYIDVAFVKESVNMFLT